MWRLGAKTLGFTCCAADFWETGRVEETQSDLVPFCAIPLLASFYCARAVNSKHNSFVQGDNSSPISFLVTFLVCAHTHPWFHPAPSTSHFLSFFKRKVVYIFAKLISVRWCFSLPTSCSFNLRSCVSDVSLLALVAFTWAFLPICLVVRVRLVQVIACAPLPPSQSFKVTETMKLGLLFFSLVFFLERISVDLFIQKLKYLF